MSPPTDDTTTLHPLPRHLTLKQRLLSELTTTTHPLLSLIEPDDRIIDLRRTFAPTPRRRTIVVKGLILLLYVDLLRRSIAERGPTVASRRFYMAYLTNWAFVTSLAYQSSSFLCAAAPEGWWMGGFNPPRQQQQAARHENDELLLPPGWMMARVTWVLYSIVAPGEIMVALLFWILDYDRGTTTITYTIVMMHGGVSLLLLFDGSIVNATPVRVRHLIFLESFVVGYVTWSVIFALSDVGNPDRVDDDAIYDALRWKEEPWGGVVLALGCVFFVAPGVFFLCWCLSFWSWGGGGGGGCCGAFDGSRRRYIVDEAVDEPEWNSRTDDIELSALVHINVAES